MATETPTDRFILPYRPLPQHEVERIIRDLTSTKIQHALWMTASTFSDGQRYLAAHDPLPEGKRVFLVSPVNGEHHPAASLQVVVGPQLSWIKVYDVPFDALDVYQVEYSKTRHHPCLELMLILSLRPGEAPTTFMRGQFDALAPVGRLCLQVASAFEQNVRMLERSN